MAKILKIYNLQKWQPYKRCKNGLNSQNRGKPSQDGFPRFFLAFSQIGNRFPRAQLYAFHIKHSLNFQLLVSRRSDGVSTPFGRLLNAAVKITLGNGSCHFPMLKTLELYEYIEKYFLPGFFWMEYEAGFTLLNREPGITMIPKYCFVLTNLYYK